jgi:hypothetical protein
MLRILLTVLRTVRYLVVHIPYAFRQNTACAILIVLRPVLYIVFAVHFSNIVTCASCTVLRSYSTYFEYCTLCFMYCT